VKLPAKWTYEDWCEGIRAGRNYVGDGHSHLLDFAATAATTVRMGEDGSELRLAEAAPVKFHVRVAARLDEQPESDIGRRKFDQQPYWHIERARIGATREVPVELIQNGVSIAQTRLVADGSFHDVDFTQEVKRSGWYAFRILPSSHTNPIFIEVGGKPIRASRRSLEWCLKSVDQCWSQKERFMKGEELTQAREAYEHARQVYRQRLAECDVE
jgi:hypothetical protein